MAGVDQADRIQHAMACVQHNARECEHALGLADFAQHEPSLSSAIAEGLRKLAAYHSELAFQAARSLARYRSAA